MPGFLGPLRPGLIEAAIRAADAGGGNVLSGAFAPRPH